MRIPVGPVLCVASLSMASIGLPAATPVQLQPFLEYAPIKAMVGQTAGTGGMGHAVLILNLDPGFTGQAKPAIIVSEYGGLQSSVVGFDGATGSPLDGWSPGAVRPTSWAGYSYLSGASQPFPRVIAAFSQKPTLVVSEHGKTLGQIAVANYHSSPLANGGYVPGYRHDLSTVIFGGEDYKVHKVSLFSYAEDFGWPKTHSEGAQRVTTPAILDINNDSFPEVFSASGNSSGGFDVRAHDGQTGMLLWVRQIPRGYPANYLSVGQINPDLSREVVLVHREPVSPFAPRITVFDANTGNSEHSDISLPGSIPYGSAPVLADLNGDGLDEVIVLTESKLNVLGGSGFTQLAGFPVDLGSVWVGDSAPVVGDIGGAAGQEIVFTTQVPGVAGQSMLHIIQQNGTYMFPRQSMQLGGGQTNAIHDLDGDGHNELVVAARGALTVEKQDAVWVFDFSRNEPEPTVHGTISWGQFGRNAERCNCSIRSLISGG